jgi:hypothetical protein
MPPMNICLLMCPLAKWPVLPGVTWHRLVYRRGGGLSVLVWALGVGAGW